MRRASLLVVSATMLMATMVVPAGATPAPAPGAIPEDGHKITICHATRSLSNPYVEIEIDVAAWNVDTDPQHHGDHHTRTKDGITWKDYVLEPGQECGLTPPGGSCAGRDVDYVAEFTLTKNPDGTWASLLPTRQTMVSNTVAIPPGDYAVVLGSWDDSPAGSPTQDNEQWRANFGDGIYSDFSDDLPTNAGRPTAAQAIAYDGGTVTLESTVTEVIAEHWSIIPAHEQSEPNSVNPLCVGLIED